MSRKPDKSSEADGAIAFFSSNLVPALQVYRREPADGSAAVADSKDDVAGSDPLFPDHLQHLCVGLCDPL